MKYFADFGINPAAFSLIRIPIGLRSRFCGKVVYLV
jgi:hypothetical protein